jgi:hypothetical protein
MFSGDEEALERVGVGSVEELLQFTDVDGDRKLALSEVMMKERQKDM